MKKLVLLILITFISLYSYCQDCEDTDFREYHTWPDYWEDTIISHQKAFYPEGGLSREITRLPNNKRLLKQYSRKGRIQFTAEVYQVFTIDSNYTEDLLTGEMELVVETGYKDILHGRYVEFHELRYSSEDIPKTIGQFTNGEMTGIWETEIGNVGYIVTGTFNKKGQLEGEYVEYYISQPKSKEKVKWKGQYGITSVKSKVYDYNINDYVYKKVERSERIGTWIKYNELGEPIQSVTYNWNY